MGKAASKASRQTVQKFNVESRAHRVIDKAERTRPVIAPKHPSSEDGIKKIQKEHPEWLEAQKTKHSGLDSMLKGMVVDPEKFGEIQATRSLPDSRAKSADPEFGFLEPEYIRPGRCSIRQAIEFIGLHTDKPREYTTEKIASEYKLSVENTQDALKYFRTFEVQLPRQLREKLGIVDPKKHAKDLLQGGSKELPGGKTS